VTFKQAGFSLGDITEILDRKNSHAVSTLEAKLNSLNVETSELRRAESPGRIT